MSRLEEIKQNHAVSVHFNSWEELLLMSVSVDKHIDVICKQYAKECSQASLEKASRIAKTFKNSNSGSYLDASIDKRSITQESNIVLL